MHLIDSTEMSLDDSISVYSDEYQTELRYRGSIDIANQSPFDEKFTNTSGVKILITFNGFGNPSCAVNRQDGVHYLLLCQRLIKNLLVALVQPMSANLTQLDLAFFVMHFNSCCRASHQ